MSALLEINNLWVKMAKSMAKRTSSRAKEVRFISQTFSGLDLIVHVRGGEASSLSAPLFWTPTLLAAGNSIIGNAICTKDPKKLRTQLSNQDFRN